MYKVSIIIPVYNVENYIVQCIESIINQSYKNLEIIIVDDGSTDTSPIIISNYAKKYNNIKFIIQENQGVSQARNNGLKISTGEYIVFIDPDDYIHVDYIKKMVEKSIETKSDIIICGYQLMYDDIEGKNRDICRCEKSFTLSGTECASKMLNLELEGYLWDKLFRRNLLIEHEFSFEEGRYIQDWFPVYREVVLANSVTFISDVLYFYRQRSTSTVHRKNYKKLEDYGYAANKIKNYSIEMNLDRSLINKFLIDILYDIILEINKLENANNKVSLKANWKHKLTLSMKNVEIYLSKSIPIKTKMKLFLIETHLIEVMSII